MIKSSLKLMMLAVLIFPSTSWALSVTRVIDGDTVVLSDGQKVRLIGIDTPELHYSQKLIKDSARTGQDLKTIQALGKRAAEFTRHLVDGKIVRLEFDRERHDKYRRTLGYLFLSNGTFVNLEIIRQGYANAYTRFPFKYMERFRAAEREARINKRGLWK